MSTHAIGFCDRCGFKYKLADLREEVRDKRKTGIKTCPTCYEPDHEQLQVGKKRIVDPIALPGARTDTSLTESRSVFSWNPVGFDDMYLVANVGQVKAS